MTTEYAWDRLGAEVMDTRDLITVADEIRTALDDYAEGDELSLEALPANENGSPDDTEQEARAILAAIDGIEDVGIPDWQYGEALIREDYMEDYARELAEDIGAVNADAAWPASHIDWKSATEALLQDYIEVDYRGTTYYARA